MRFHDLYIFFICFYKAGRRNSERHKAFFTAGFFFPQPGDFLLLRRFLALLLYSECT